MKQKSKKLIREEKIKRVALDSFLANGYENTNLNEIIKKSGGSLSSIYERFKNKEGLFLEVLNDLLKNNSNLINQKMKNLKNKDLKNILIKFGILYLEILNDIKTISFGKIIYSQVYNEKINILSWIEKIYENSSQTILINYIKNEKICNIFNIEKIIQTYCIMLKEPNFTLSVLTNKEPLNSKQRKEHVELIVDLLLNGINKY